MNLAEKMRAKSKEVTNKEKLDIIFNEFVLPRIEKAVHQKKTEVSFDNFTIDKADSKVKELFPKCYCLQYLVHGEMKPYLEQQGFKVIECNPSYYTYVRW